MKITNLDKGKAYQLKPDTRLSVERTNPFFNEYAEQTVPCSLPASAHNMRLLDMELPQGNRVKQQLHDVTIADGEYFAQCQQAVLSVRRNHTVSTSFYLNDGSLYARIGDVSLKDIWTGEYQKLTYGSGTVDDMIQLCRLLAGGTTLDGHPVYGNYRIFPVLLKDDAETGVRLNYKILNNWGCERQLPWNMAEHVFVPLYGNAVHLNDFLNASDTQEYVGELSVTVPKGYYISPFIRVEYVLKRIFSHFGYTLTTRFFDDEPFRSMVLLNNVIDTIINGYALNADLVPDITCKEFLSVIRHKFCCEFVPDEQTRTVDIVFFQQAADYAPVMELGRLTTEQPQYDYLLQKQYKRVKLTPKYTDLDDEEGVATYETIEALLHDYPSARYDPATDTFYRVGYRSTGTVRGTVGKVNGYDAGGSEEPDDVEIADRTPAIRRLYILDADGKRLSAIEGTFLYIGKYNTLHSKIQSDNGEETENQEETLVPMLAFTFQISNRGKAGVISARSDVAGTTTNWKYSLTYWGKDGIFERFHLKKDYLLRNALEQLKVRLLLSQHQKMNLKATDVYTLQGMRVMFDKLAFTLGTHSEPVESTLRSLSVSQPIKPAATTETVLPDVTAQYKWTPVANQLTTPPAEDVKGAPTVIFPPVPAAEYVGIRYGYQKWYTHVFGGEIAYYEGWLECTPI